MTETELLATIATRQNIIRRLRTIPSSAERRLSLSVVKPGTRMLSFPRVAIIHDGLLLLEHAIWSAVTHEMMIPWDFHHGKADLTAAHWGSPQISGSFHVSQKTGRDGEPLERWLAREIPGTDFRDIDEQEVFRFLHWTDGELPDGDIAEPTTAPEFALTVVAGVTETVVLEPEFGTAPYSFSLEGYPLTFSLADNVLTIMNETPNVYIAAVTIIDSALPARMGVARYTVTIEEASG